MIFNMFMKCHIFMYVYMYTYVYSLTAEILCVFCVCFVCVCVCVIYAAINGNPDHPPHGDGTGQDGDFYSISTKFPPEGWGISACVHSSSCDKDIVLLLGNGPR